MPSGSVDLAAMLGTLEVLSRPEPYIYAVVEPGHPLLAVADAVVQETEGSTVVVRQAEADLQGVAYEFVAAWLTLSVHSSLAAVGLTAAISAALSEVGISCNVLAGNFHDHLLVPLEDRARALETLAALQQHHAQLGS